MISIGDFLNEFIEFPNLSFLKPIFGGVVLLLCVDIIFEMIWSTFAYFWGK